MSASHRRADEDPDKQTPERFENAVEGADDVQQGILDRGESSIRPFFFVGGLGVAVWLSLRWIVLSVSRGLQSYRASRWPKVQGMVELGDVDVRRAGLTEEIGADMADARLAYSYRVGEEYYAGYGNKLFVDEQKAWDFVDFWKGKTVTIRQHPRKPGVSYFRLKDQAR